jgi:Fe-S-cluster containining protein
MEHNCDCNTCANACTFKPGWFRPGEVEKVAEHLGTTVPELFAKSLMVDWLDPCEETKGEEVFLLSPAIVEGTPGSEFGGDPKGTCVFFTADRKCSIYEVRPFECREYLHDQTPEEASPCHMAVGASWADHQQQIKDLLGRDPESEPYYASGGLLGSLFGF